LRSATLKRSITDPAGAPPLDAVGSGRAEHAMPRIAICGAGEICGGVERFIVTMARGLHTRRVPVLAIVFHEGLLARSLRDSGVPLEVVTCRTKYDPSAVTRLIQVLSAHRIDLLHVNGYKATVLGGLAAKAMGIRTVKTEHGRLEPAAGWLDIWRYIKLGMSGAMDRLATRRLVDDVVCVSHELKQHAAVARARRPPTVIYNGLDLRVSDGARRPFDLGLDDFNIGIIGRLAVVKGHRYAFEALRRLDHVRNIRLHVFGEGPLEKRYRTYCRNAGLGDKVIFHGFCENIAEYVQHLDVFVMPSLSEGLPYSLLEAMSCRVPVIASRVGGLPEAVGDAAAILISPRDHSALAAGIERLYNSPELRQCLGERGYRRVSTTFEASRMISEYLRVYERLLES
jgi:glycosyltransferase involved in cell wall biosynthesis